MAILIAGVNQTASVPIKVIPSGLRCGIKIYLTSDFAGASVKAQSSIVSFTSTGGQQIVAASLVAPAAGTYYVFVAVYIKDILIGVWQNEDVVIGVPTALTLYYTNPVSYQPVNRNDPPTSHWSVNMYDPITHTWEGGVIVPLSDPQILHPKGNTFLLHIYEWFGPWSYGLYLVTISGLGTYTFNGKARTINGGTVTYMPGVRNMSDLHTTLIRTTGNAGSPNDFNAIVRVNESIAVPGYENWGRFFVGDTIEIRRGEEPIYTGDIVVGPNGEFNISAVLCETLWGKCKWFWAQYADSAYAMG